MTDDTHSIHDPVDPARARALQATLGHPPTLQAGDALPPFFHQLYFWDPQVPADLGRDGHPKVGGIIPDMGLPRRMWAGGKLAFHAPFRAGQPATRQTFRERAETKQGRSGPLAFVTLRHEIWQDETRCITEHQDLVYREDTTSRKPDPPRAPDGASRTTRISFDSTLLFRYSALTFNGHRIHYDETYARQVEGYDGLVVHGPLLAHLLMQMADAELGGLKTFAFRATSPLMHHDTAELCWGRDGHCWVRGPDGRQCMTAQAG
ncbi:MAG: MaoC family dehydratase N-terminal domain-containing protein [Roseovarius sp.]